MQLRSPYPNARRMPHLGDRNVEPEEVVDVPEDLVESFLAAGWREPNEPIVWPPAPAVIEDQAPDDVDQAADKADDKAKPKPKPTPPGGTGSTSQES